MEICPSLQRCASRVSSRIGSIKPEYPVCFTLTSLMAAVIVAAAVIVPLMPTGCVVRFSMAAPMETSPDVLARNLETGIQHFRVAQNFHEQLRLRIAVPGVHHRRADRCRKFFFR